MVFRFPFWKKSGWRFPYSIRKMASRIHPHLGKILFFCSFANVYTGMTQLEVGYIFYVLYWLWMSLLMGFVLLREGQKIYVAWKQRALSKVVPMTENESEVTQKVEEGKETEFSSDSEPKEEKEGSRWKYYWNVFNLQLSIFVGTLIHFFKSCVLIDVDLQLFHSVY
jgi:hypothetical protein